MPLLLGFDAGGTTTECALADGARILCRVRGASIKIIRVAKEEAESNLDAILESIALRTGVSSAEICATCVGTAGIRLPSLHNWLRNALRQRVGGKILLCGDDEIALDAAFPGRSGVLVIAGTGSNVLGRTSRGERVNVGGWGPVISDEGSAHWIGLEGLRSALRGLDRGEKTPLLDKLADVWGANGVWGIVERAHSNPPPDFAAVAPLVSLCAEQGDPTCFQVLADAGRLLADAAVLTYRKMRLLEPGSSECSSIAFTGSVLSSVQIVREEMLDSIRRQIPGVTIVREAVDPVMGALWHAMRACGEAAGSGGAKQEQI